MESALRVGGGQAAEAGRGDVLELAVGDVAHGGWCVARQPGGLVVFVRHALPGERVLARVTETTAKFARAEAVEVLRASPDRVTPPCPHARPDGCGGCDWQHASPAAQRRLKAEVVRHQLRRIAGLDREVAVEPVPGDVDGLGWRTRIRFSVNADGAAGLRKHRSHEVLALGECPIAHPLVAESGVTRQRWDGVASVEVVVSPGSGERAVILTPSGRQPVASPAAGVADTALIASRGRLTPVRGRGHLRQVAAGRTWRVGAGVFWQVHPGLADTLARAMLEALRPRPGDVAFDLFCGAGLFAGVLAQAVGPDGAVIAVEADRAAVRDARHNVRDSPWARVHRGDVAAVLAGQDWQAPGPAGLAVLDPPRAGAGRAVIEPLLACGLRRVAYVSCDPATLARDVAIFAESGWELTGLRAFDAFPMTHHVECVATLAPAARNSGRPSAG